MKRDRDLVKTLQAIYDSEINFVIAMCWDGGVDFAFLSQMQLGTDDDLTSDWYKVDSFDKLADALHAAAMRKYPQSDYAKGEGQEEREEAGTR